MERHRGSSALHISSDVAAAVSAIDGRGPTAADQNEPVDDALEVEGRAPASPGTGNQQTATAGPAKAERS